MAGDFRFGGPRQEQANVPGSSGRSGGGLGDAIARMGGVLSNRANARALAAAQTEQAYAKAFETMHTNETNIRLEALKNENQIVLGNQALEQKALEGSVNRGNLRVQSALTDRSFAQMAEFAERMASQGHSTAMETSREGKVSIKTTPKEPDMGPVLYGPDTEPAPKKPAEDEPPFSSGTAEKPTAAAAPAKPGKNSEFNAGSAHGGSGGRSSVPVVTPGESTEEPKPETVASSTPASSPIVTPVTRAPSSVVTAHISESEPKSESERESAPQSDEETYVTGPHETDVEKIKSMFTVTTNKFGHKEAVFKSPAIKNGTKLKDTVKVYANYWDGDEAPSYSTSYKGNKVTLKNGLDATIGEGGSSGVSVGDKEWDVATPEEAFNKTLDLAARKVAKHHSYVNQMLTQTREELDANSARRRAFYENRIGKPCSFCGEKIDSYYDSSNGHALMLNGWCQNAFYAVKGAGHWADDNPEHEKGE